MPKDVSERIIDWPYISAGNRGGSISIGGGGGGGGGGGSATNLNALTDVTLSAPTNGQTLSYNSGSGQWVNAAPAAMTAHGLSSSYHTGTLNWPLINFSGSDLADLATRQHSVLQGIGPNDHHDQAHVLATGTALGADHTISGAVAGEVLRALSATTAAFDVLHHTDLDNILPDQHHTRAHDIITGDASGPVHTVVGGDFTVVGVHPTDTLDLLPTSSAPGAAISILKTDVNGAIQLDTNLLYVDGANNWIGVNRTPSGATLDLIAYSNADHTQRIKMKSGQTARLWRIEDLSGNELIVLDSVGNLQSGRPGFVSGLTGWQITPQGNAEFNNIWARGELHATVFVKDEVHATGGTLLVATAGTLHDDAVIDSSTVDEDVLVVYSTPAGAGVPLQVVTTSGTFVGNELHVIGIRNLINVNDPPSGPGFYFQPGDIVRSKTEVPTGVTDFWLEINSATQNDGYSTYSVYKRSGTDGTLPKGAALVSYGREGDGRILMTSDLNYAPYIDVFTVGPNVWTGDAGAIVPRMRMGRLDGIGLPGVSGVTQYGMIAGKDLSDANTGYLIASNLQFSLYKVDIRLNNGVSDTGLWTADGNLKIGSNVGATATTGFSVFTTGGRSGDVVIGNEATGNFLRWQQATGVLTVTGNLVVADPGTTVTKTYVDNQDAYYDNLAGGTYTSNGVLGGYALVGQANSQNYAEARRVTGVTGTWTSATANQISWTGLTATFVNGGSRSIFNGNTGSMTVRKYLYVNVSLGGTLTMIPTDTPAVSQPNYVLIAVCDPGSPKASVTVVAGTTFISGANIATGSIQAGNIASHTITANEIATGTITVSYLDPVYVSGVNSGISDAADKGQQGIDDAKDADDKAVAANTKAQQGVDDAKDAQDAADAAALAAAANKTYGDQRRVLGVSGTWTVVNGNTISWSALAVNFASGGSRSITFQTNVAFTPGGRWYLYVDVGSGTGAMAMQPPTQTLSTLGLNDVLIAVVDTSTAGPTPKASINIVAGSTYISGGNIMTGSIVAANIAATAISADKLNVTDLNAITAGTGTLTVTDELILGNAVGKTGSIHSLNKTAYNDTTSGVFLGYDTTPNAGYKFGVGDANNYIQWGGTGLPLSIRTEGGISLYSQSASATTLRFLSGFGNVSLYTEDDPQRSARIRCDSPWKFDWEVTATKFIQTGDTLQLAMERTNITSWTSTGFIGELAWQYDGLGGGGNVWLYLCYETNRWARISIPLAPW